MEENNNSLLDHFYSGICDWIICDLRERERKMGIIEYLPGLIAGIIVGIVISRLIIRKLKKRSERKWEDWMKKEKLSPLEKEYDAYDR